SSPPTTRSDPTASTVRRLRPRPVATAPSRLGTWGRAGRRRRSPSARSGRDAGRGSGSQPRSCGRPCGPRGSHSGGPPGRPTPPSASPPPAAPPAPAHPPSPDRAQSSAEQLPLPLPRAGHPPVVENPPSLGGLAARRAEPRLVGAAGGGGEQLAGVARRQVLGAAEIECVKL